MRTQAHERMRAWHINRAPHWLPVSNYCPFLRPAIPHPGQLPSVPNPNDWLGHTNIILFVRGNAPHNTLTPPEGSLKPTAPKLLFAAFRNCNTSLYEPPLLGSLQTEFAPPYITSSHPSAANTICLSLLWAPGMKLNLPYGPKGISIAYDFSRNAEWC